MAMQHYLSFTHKFHHQVLSTLCKHSLVGEKLAKVHGQRAFCKISEPSDVIETNLLNQQTGGRGHKREAFKESEQDLFNTDLAPEQSDTLSNSNAPFKSVKLRPSLAAGKYFKKTFYDNYPSFVQDSERSILYDADRFGSLSENVSDNNEKGSKSFRDERDPNERFNEMLPEDIDERRDRRLNIPLTREGRIGKNAYYYTRKMSILGKQGKIKEAIAVFDHWMMLRDRVMPNKRTFNVLIGILGRVGYTDKAFELYSQMRNLGLDPEDQVYTGLFNACANSPWPKQSLKQAENLFSALQDKGIQLNLITVKAAAKAMAFCGNFPRAFTIMDEASTYLTLDAECFNHLLMACAADKQKGFCRALQVWQKMQEFNVQPQTNTYNLLIRSIRDCGIGDPDEFAKALGLSSGKSKLLGQVGLLTSSESIQSHDNSDSQLTLSAGQIADREQLQSDPSGMTSSFVDNDAKSSSFHWTNKDVAESYLPKQETHNLFHNIPNFDRDIAEFLTQRDAEREKSVSADMYEWWEKQPSDMQQQLENQLSLVAQLDWTALDTDQCDTEALRISFMKDNNLTPTIQADSERATDTLVRNTFSIQNYPSMSDSKESKHVSPECLETLSEISAGQSGTLEKTLLVKDITTPAHRLALLGGAGKLVSHMSQSGAAPDVKTFSQLVPCLPSTEQAENDLLQSMEEIGVTPDVDLINDLMLKRNFRHSGHSAKELLPVMSRLGLVPNMRTYAALALTCLKERDAHCLLSDMKAANLEPSSDVMGHFIYISRTNFSYKLHMLQKMEWMGLAPVPETITAIEKSIAITKKNIIAAEKRRDEKSYYLSKEYQERFQRFLNFYKGWLQRTALHKTHHPWKAFQMPNHKKEDPDEDEYKTSTA